MMERTLQQSTYEVFAARDGPHAAHLLCEPDGSRLALIDWMMPQLDRSAVCREVRSRHGGAYAYILLLTAKRSSEDIVQGLEHFHLRYIVDSAVTEPGLGVFGCDLG
jgi:DNA-binding response OmpR family regulator